jgi:ABC-2 type transport system permease protein
VTSASLLGRPGGFTTSATSRLSPRERFRRIVDYRRILGLLVRRDLKVRYAGSALGYLWVVLEPLLMSLVFWFIFTQIIGRKVGYQPYILFLVIGQMMWAWFNGGVSGAVRALRAEAQMVRQSNVPRELWVLRVVASKGVEFVFSLPVIALFAVCYLKTPSWQVCLLPLAMLMCFLLVLGVGLILAPLTVLVHDIERVVPIVLRMLFYMSPVLYSIKDVPVKLHAVMSLNPMVGILGLARASFFPVELSGQVPRRHHSGKFVYHHGQVVMHYVNNWHFVRDSAIEIVLLLALGWLVFARLERPVLKEI